MVCNPPSAGNSSDVLLDVSLEFVGNQERVVCPSEEVRFMDEGVSTKLCETVCGIVLLSMVPS